MSLLQLVRRRGANGNTVLDAVPNPEDRPYPEVIAQNERPLLLGSAELLKVAVRLRESGFRVSGATITDPFYRPLDDESLRDLLVNTINSIDQTGVDDYVQANLQGVHVAALALNRKTPTISTIRLTQNGGLSLSTPDDWVLENVRRAVG